jgi:hypothetical protein
MKSTEAPPQKSKPAAARTMPTAAEGKAVFEKLSQKDRDSFERQVVNAETKGGEPLAKMWRRLAGVAIALAPKTSKLTGPGTMQFFIPDGKHRKQVFAMTISDTGTLTVFVPNVLPEAIKAHIVTPVPKSPVPNTFTVGKGGEQIIIEQLDRDTPNPQFYFKDMTGWNRKAIGIVLPPTASEALIHTAEQFLLLAATWPVIVDEPMK